MWVSVLWKVFGCFAHDAKYQDDSGEKKKRLSNICPFRLYDAKHIFGNTEMSDVVATNFLDEQLWLFFFSNSLFWCCINHF